MSDLTQLRDHARFMAGREHAAGCPPTRSRHDLAHTRSGERWCGAKAGHDAHGWSEPSPFGSGYAYSWHCRGVCGGCGGCMPDSERALWVSIAEEVTAYVERGDEGQETLL